MNQFPGFSSSYTPEKQQHYVTFLGMHLRATQGVILNNRWAPPYYSLYDLNAGPGYDAAGGWGSPLHFLSQATRYLTAIPFEAHFYENDSRTAECLRQPLSAADCDGGRYTLHECSHTEAVHHMPVEKAALGLVYSDENAASIPLPLLEWIATHRQRLDLLIHCTATTIKRVRSAFPDRFAFGDILQQCPKKVWMVREPYGRHQWTFLYGTNWVDAPVLARQRFHAITSPRGMGILHLLDTTAKERAAGEDTDIST